jgi:hypothetical protein
MESVSSRRSPPLASVDSRIGRRPNSSQNEASVAPFALSASCLRRSTTRKCVVLLVATDDRHLVVAAFHRDRRHAAQVAVERGTPLARGTYRFAACCALFNRCPRNAPVDHVATDFGAGGERRPGAAWIAVRIAHFTVVRSPAASTQRSECEQRSDSKSMDSPSRELAHCERCAFPPLALGRERASFSRFGVVAGDA